MAELKWVRMLEAAGIVAFLALGIRAFQNLAGDSPLTALALCVLAVPLAYFCADFLTGIIHWVCDSFGSAATPLWGPMLVAPFRRHHGAPLDITRISLLENLGASALVGALVLWLWSPERQLQDSLAAQLLQYFWLWMVIFAVLSNLFHRWSHIPHKNKPQWMLRLQEWHLILDTREHLAHHHRPYRVNYCILCGWANPLSNRVPWHRLEAALARVGIPTHFD